MCYVRLTRWSIVIEMGSGGGVGDGAEGPQVQVENTDELRITDDEMMRLRLARKRCRGLQVYQLTTDYVQAGVRFNRDDPCHSLLPS